MRRNRKRLWRHYKELRKLHEPFIKRSPLIAAIFSRMATIILFGGTEEEFREAKRDLKKAMRGERR